jgi:orotate phosphoribosyltransferase
MHSSAKDFLQFAIENKALTFGDFTLKSGRKSPYFFNAGVFNSGKLLQQLGSYYATAIQQVSLNFDVLFGPAYKGISLATSTAIALAQQYSRDIPVCFNRKEIKNHGEGGALIGAPLKGNVLMIDDVITAGTAFRETKKIIDHHDARLIGILIALDRQERGTANSSAIEEIRNNYQIPVLALANLDDLITYLQQQIFDSALIEKIQKYQESYGA